MKQTSTTADVLRRRLLRFVQHTPTTNGINRRERWKSRESTGSDIRRSSTAPGLHLKKLARIASGYVGRIGQRLTRLLAKWAREIRRSRVDHLRSQAYGGGDVERYVQARKEFWYRYER